MEEIKVGEYVRTEQGIRRVLKITIEPEVDIGIAVMPEVTALWTSESEYFEAKDIYEHSKNIIDLIEEHDYINGYEVSFIDYPYCYINAGTDGSSIQIKNEDIKSIVTKEQFKSMEYNIGE